MSYSYSLTRPCDSIPDSCCILKKPPLEKGSFLLPACSVINLLNTTLYVINTSTIIVLNVMMTITPIILKIFYTMIFSFFKTMLLFPMPTIMNALATKWWFYINFSQNKQSTTIHLRKKRKKTWHSTGCCCYLFLLKLHTIISYSSPKERAIQYK